MGDESDTVNIRIGKDTWQRLNRKYKNEPGKTWDDVMQELLSEAETAAVDAEDEEANEGDPNPNTPLTKTAD